MQVAGPTDAALNHSDQGKKKKKLEPRKSADALRVHFITTKSASYSGALHRGY